MENTLVLNTLFIGALALLVLVSGGVLYLTALEWGDRRRLEESKRQQRQK